MTPDASRARPDDAHSAHDAFSPTAAQESTSGKVGHDTDGDALVSSLESQTRIYQRLRQLVAKQRALVSVEDPSELLALLAERRKVTDELNGLTDGIGRFSKRWARARSSLSAEQRRRVDRLVTESRSTLKEIMAADTEDSRILAVRKDRVATALTEIPAERATLSAYGRDATATATIVDRTDEQA